jgi:uncharacterized coiled-coil protein SlyX
MADTRHECSKAGEIAVHAAQIRNLEKWTTGISKKVDVLEQSTTRSETIIEGLTDAVTELRKTAEALTENVNRWFGSIAILKWLIGVMVATSITTMGVVIRYLLFK